MTIREVADGQAGLPTPQSTSSYWHKEPSRRLKGHRSTPKLPETADLVIIGSGMTGAFAAYRVKQDEVLKEQKVVMLEAREACWGATGRNGGHCQPFLFKNAPEVAAFELRVYQFLQAFAKDNDIDCAWQSLAGVHPQFSKAYADDAASEVHGFQLRNPELADMVAYIPEESNMMLRRCLRRPEWAKDMTLASLRVPNAQGAVVQRYAASMWPYKLVCWVLEKLLDDEPASSFNLQTNTPVTKVSKISPSDGGWIVQTSRGCVKARNVLLATNAYTSRLLPKFSDLIVPVRAQVGALLPPKPQVELDHSYDFWGQLCDRDGNDVTRGEYLVQRPLPGGELILGGARYKAKGCAVGVWNDDEIEEPVAEFLRAELEPVLNLRSINEADAHKPSNQELEATWEWTGIMGYARDAYPWVGQVPDELGGGKGLWMSSGYTGHGMPRAALCGVGVVKMMKGDKNHGVPKVFLPSEDRAKRARKRPPVGFDGGTTSFETMFSPW